MPRRALAPHFLLYALLIAPGAALGGIKTNFERIGLRRIKFGGTFQLREPFRGVRAGRAADYLSDPLRVIAAAWPPHLIKGPTVREDGVLDYDLEQETINFAGLLTVDGVVDMEELKRVLVELDLERLGGFPLFNARTTMEGRPGRC